jgi:hypothetical protein
MSFSVSKTYKRQMRPQPITVQSQEEIELNKQLIEAGLDPIDYKENNTRQMDSRSQIIKPVATTGLKMGSSANKKMVNPDLL